MGGRYECEDAALQVACAMEAGQFIDLDCALALEAARHPLLLADSIIYASTVRDEASLWTQEEHFKGLPNVRFFPRQPPAPPRT